MRRDANADVAVAISDEKWTEARLLKILDPEVAENNIKANESALWQRGQYQEGRLAECDNRKKIV